METSSKYIYPSILAPFIYAVQRAYTKPSSLFIRKVTAVVTIAGGIWLGLKNEVRLTNIFLLNNYHLFPEDVRYALQSADARYLRKYWREEIGEKRLQPSA